MNSRSLVKLRPANQAPPRPGVLSAPGVPNEAGFASLRWGPGIGAFGVFTRPPEDGDHVLVEIGDQSRKVVCQEAASDSGEIADKLHPPQAFAPGTVLGYAEDGTDRHRSPRSDFSKPH